MQTTHPPVTANGPSRLKAPFNNLSVETHLWNYPADLDQLHPDWQAMPYHSVLAVLPEGSTFYIPIEHLAWLAAQKIALPAISPSSHLAEQIVPVVQQDPTVLIDFAHKMPWSEISRLVVQPCWRSPVHITGPRLWPHAKLSLDSFRQASVKGRLL